jgi:NTP pyrophosphatase (non-canonical NTP hydrolase)
MLFSEYRKEALKTAIYPNLGKDCTYPALGLIGEVGEFVGKVSKVYRDHNGDITPLLESIRNELGDCLWMCAMLCYEWGVDIPDNFIHNNDWLPDITTSLYGICIEMSYTTSLMFEVGSNTGITHVDLVDARSFLLDLIICINYIVVQYLDCDLDFLFRMNLEKLNSRKSRGELRGSGDTR